MNAWNRIFLVRPVKLAERELDLCPGLFVDRPGKVVGGPLEKLAYTVPEVAERISLGTTTVRQLIHARKLGCVGVGRALVFPKTCVEEFLAREATVITG